MGRPRHRVRYTLKPPACQVHVFVEYIGETLLELLGMGELAPVLVRGAVAEGLMRARTVL